MSKITEQMLKEIMPHTPKLKRQSALPILNKTAFDYQINNEKRIAAWLATVAVESGELKYQEELASGKAYEGREDLGNTNPGDGVRYKGHGRIQITGRFNHKLYTDYLKKSGHLPFVDFVKEPQRLAHEPYATDSAGWFFAIHIKANPLADRSEFLEIQLRVNGGRKRKPPRPNHWEERRAYYTRALRVIPDDFLLDQINGQDVEDVDFALAESSVGYPDFEIKDSVAESADPSVEATDATESGELGTPSSPDSSKVEVKVDGDKINVTSTSQDTNQPKERIAVVKAPKERWFNRVWTKVAAAVTGSAFFQWIWAQLETIRGLPLPDMAWVVISITISVLLLLWIIYEIVDTWRDNRNQERIDNLLITENSTSDNLVQLIPEDEIELYRRRGFKIITR